jgi:putative serine protease PepD
MTKAKSRFPALLAIAALVVGSVATVGVFEASGSLGATTTTAAPSGGNSSISSNTTTDAASLYAQASPGLVDITSKGITTTTSQGLFGQPQKAKETATGSGFVTDSQGQIVTAAHVVDGATSITAKFQDGTTRAATVLGKDTATDIAVLKVDPAGLTLHPLTLGSSAALRVGNGIAAIGDPFGYERSFSTGVVSGLDRTISAPNGFNIAHAIQTDAALNPGNSGGAMLDASGKVIGIVDQIATGGGSDQNSGVGFAIPVDLVRSELPTLAAGKKVEHPYLGVSTSDTSAGNGALVQQVVSGGPSSSGGLRAGDVISQIDGQKIEGSSDLVATVAGHKPGDKLSLTVVRNGKTTSLTVTLGVQPSKGPSPTAAG